MVDPAPIQFTLKLINLNFPLLLLTDLLLLTEGSNETLHGGPELLQPALQLLLLCLQALPSVLNLPKGGLPTRLLELPRHFLDFTLHLLDLPLAPPHRLALEKAPYVAGEEGPEAALLLGRLIWEETGGGLDFGAQEVGAIQAAAPEVDGRLEGIGPAPKGKLSDDGALGVEEVLRRGRAGHEEVADVRRGDAFLGGRRADEEDEEAGPRLRGLLPAPRVGLWLGAEGPPFLSEKRSLRPERRPPQATIGVGAPHPPGGSGAVRKPRNSLRVLGKTRGRR